VMWSPSSHSTTTFSSMYIHVHAVAPTPYWKSICGQPPRCLHEISPWMSFPACPVGSMAEAGYGEETGIASFFFIET
jgi:hypothetical protein